ncbi:MAG TPA: metallophosphoesterase family protein [Chloroflexota bacterium]|nr:metallophosphoesterase family protein [Chloroflexota bacterium]
MGSSPTPLPRWQTLLPAQLPVERVVARIGLVSDTHLPERCPALPPALSPLFGGVELILHAGDLGELAVLDHLSAVAPVVAVHGNDDTPEAQRELPYQQVVGAAGRRLLLCHTHFPDPVEEAAWRRSSHPPGAALARRAAMGRRAGADVVVFGHSHVPVVTEFEGVLLVNPGAIAPPNAVTRMRHQTVALLYLRDDGVPFVVHVDLAAPDRPFAPSFWTAHDWRTGIRQMVPHFVESVLEPELAPRWQQAWEEHVSTRPEAERHTINTLLCRLAYPCWRGQRAHVTRDEMLEAFRSADALPPTTREQVLRTLTS